MGVQEKEQKLRKKNDKRFLFDWDSREDTFNEDPLYAERKGATLFGKGHIAGMDMREQKKRKGEYYDALIKARKTEDEAESRQ